jgi:hypothetical protein
METIDISHLPKARVLAALYNRSAPQGLGILQYREGQMTEQQAEELLKKQTYFDYLYGRVMKIDLSTNELRPWLYDRDLGQGACAEIIAQLS